MKRFFLLHVYGVLSCIFLVFTCCVSLQQKAQWAWHQNSGGGEKIFVAPRVLKNKDEAISIIKLNQPNFVEWNGDEIIDLYVDNYGMVINTRWETTKTKYKVKPVTYSGFSSKKLSSYYSYTTYKGQNVTSTKTGTKSYSMQFKNIDFISLWYRYDIDREYKWEILFKAKEGTSLNIRAKDKAVALDLVNAVYTITAKNNIQVKIDALGIECAKISQAQQATTGMNNLTGIVITSISSGSPAGNSGLRVNDVITKIDGHPVINGEEMNAYKWNRKPRKIKFTVIRLTDFDNQKNIFNHEVLEKVILMK